MAKKGNKKKKKPNKHLVNGVDIMEQRTQGTVMMVLQKIEGLSIVDNLHHIYMVTGNPLKDKIMRNIEEWLIEAELQPERFAVHLHRNMKELAREIKRGNNFQTYLDLAVDCLEALDTVELDLDNAVYDLLIQLGTYCSHHENYIIGHDNGHILQSKSILPLIDVHYREALEKGARSDDDVIRYLRTKGYPFTSYREFEEWNQVENIMNNQYFSVAAFIDKSNKNFVLDRRIKILTDEMTFGLPKFTEDEVDESLQHRKRLLPNGITRIVNYRDGSSVKEVHLFEKFDIERNRKHLVFKVVMDYGAFLGFKNLDTGVIYTPFRDTIYKSKYIKHRDAVHFINELYALLTTDLDTNFELELIEEQTQDYQNVKKRKFRSRTLTKGTTEVEAYIRRLPIGQTASDEAKEQATIYGIELSPNETFVSKYIRGGN